MFLNGRDWLVFHFLWLFHGFLGQNSQPIAFYQSTFDGFWGFEVGTFPHELKQIFTAMKHVYQENIVFSRWPTPTWFPSFPFKSSSGSYPPETAKRPKSLWQWLNARLLVLAKHAQRQVSPSKNCHELCHRTTWVGPLQSLSPWKLTLQQISTRRRSGSRWR